jgi:hypothetical protein
MSLFESASLVVTPNGTKASKLYAIKPTDGSGDLTVTRATTATRVNASGLISSVAVNVPRLDYTNSTCPSVLVEPQRTNLLTYSEQFDNISWIKLNVSITANNGVSPDGNTNADAVIPNTNNDVHILRSNIFNQSGTTSHSWFVKANGYSKVAVRESELVGNYAAFDLSNGTLLSTNQTGSIVNYGNGWYRITLIDTTIGLLSQSSLVILPDSYTTGNPLINWSGDGVKGVFAYGATAEVGSYATSYIPTTTAAVTRNADVISKTGISSLIGQTEGTMFYDGIYGNEINEVYLFLQKEISTGVDDSIYIQQTSARIALNVYFGATQQVFIVDGAFTVGQRIKIAAAYKNNDFVLYVNGVQIGTDNSGSVPTCGALQFASYRGTPTASNFIANKGCKISALWKTRLTNAELAELTTI